MALPSRTLGTVILLAMGVGIGAAAYSHFSSGPEAETLALAVASHPSDVVELAEIEVSRVERRHLADDIRVSGVIDPVRKTGLVAEIGGTVDAVEFRVGDPVEAGDVLVRIGTATLDATLLAREAGLEATRAQLSLAESVLSRNRRLGESGIASEAALLEAEANTLNLEAQVRALEADVEQARIQLGHAEIRAPFAGIVSERMVEPGQAVAIGAELMSVVDLSLLEADVAVPTSRVATVELGQTAELSVDGLAGERFPAAVVRISPMAETQSRAVRVFLRFANDDPRLRGGMFATGTLRVRDFPDVIALPESAIRRDEGGSFVLKAEDGHLRRQSVEAGAAFPEDGLVEVTEGLQGGEIVVTAPLPDLQPDVEVTIAGL